MSDYIIVIGLFSSANFQYREGDMLKAYITGTQYTRIRCKKSNLLTEIQSLEKETQKSEEEAAGGKPARTPLVLSVSKI